MILKCAQVSLAGLPLQVNKAVMRSLILAVNMFSRLFPICKTLIFESSAKDIIVAFNFRSPRESIMSKNRTGPSTVPCGTPDIIFDICDASPFAITL